jgi:hypothetical protein
MVDTSDYAFPFSVVNTSPDTVYIDNNRVYSGETFGSGGMTLRDYFAGQAMAANIGRGHCPDTIANEAYKLADAMLKERNK